MHFIAPKNKVDGLMYQMFQMDIIKLCPHLIYQWLAMFHVLHDGYTDYGKILDQSIYKEIKMAANEASKKIEKENNIMSTTEDIINAEKILGDDIANVWTRANDDVEEEGEDLMDGTG
jgi:hypothetical protein